MNTVWQHALVTVSVVTALGACSSGENTQIENTTGPDNSSAYNSQVYEYFELSEQHRALDRADAANLPTSGTATYVGYLSAIAKDLTTIEGGEAYIISPTRVEVDFLNSEFNGSADEFIDEFDNPVQGHLDFAGNLEGANLRGRVDGNFRIEAGSVNAKGSMNGTLKGPSGESLALSVANGTISGADTGTFSVGLAAERTTCRQC